MSENKVLNKIDDFLDELEKKNEGRDEEYEKLFRKLAKEMGFDPEEVENLPDEKKKKFFNKLDSMWKAKKETD